MNLLSALWGLEHLPLLLWLAGRGPVTNAAVAREFPAIVSSEINRVLNKLTRLGWLNAGADGRHYAFNTEAVGKLERLLDRVLPGDWPAAELDEEALRGEISLWRAPNRLAVLHAVRDGHETRQEIEHATGLPSNSVNTAVLELLERGHIVVRSWRRWGEEEPDREVVPQARASQLRLLLQQLQASSEGLS